jgi:hypothetical protein
MACWWTLDGGVGEPAGATEPPRPGAKGKDVTGLAKDVYAEWSTRCKKLGPLDPKGAAGIWITELKTLIGDRVPKDRMHDFMLAVTAGRPGAWLTGWHRDAFLQALVDIFSRAGDRAELVEMLSRDFPHRIYYCDVECWLAVLARNTLPNGIEILFDAFDRSRDAKVREEIAASLGRAFRANGLDFGKNKKTVDACRSWYANNKDRIEPNIRYCDNIMHGPDAYANMGLFVTKHEKGDITDIHGKRATKENK